MASIRSFVCLLIAFFVVNDRAYSQDSEVFEGMTWYLKKSVAIDSARSQGKQVFLVWGRTYCAYTRGVRQKMGLYPNKSLIKDNYILWFSNVDIYSRYSPEVKDYLSNLPPSVTLPAICVIDMYDVKIGYGLKTGPRLMDELFEMLNGYVSNENILEEKNISGNVYVSGNKLIIKSVSEDETISVFFITGSLVEKFHKAEYEVTRDLTVYPKGIFIVNGSSGWTQKFVVR